MPPRCRRRSRSGQGTARRGPGCSPSSSCNPASTKRSLHWGSPTPTPSDTATSRDSRLPTSGAGAATGLRASDLLIRLGGDPEIGLQGLPALRELLLGLLVGDGGDDDHVLALPPVDRPRHAPLSPPLHPPHPPPHPAP